MKELFDEIIKNTVKHLLSENGFRKKALNFYKQKEDLIFLLNFQKSQGNSAEQTRFYINCGIHSLNIDRALNKPEQTEPKDMDCYYSDRISQITDSITDGYDITEDTDIQKLICKLTADLSKVLQFYSTVNSTTDLVNLMINENGLNNYKELFEYLLITGNIEGLTKYITVLYKRFGDENRWTIFENNMNKILSKYDNQQTLEELIKK